MLQCLGYEADMSDLKYWVGFNRIPGIGRAKFSQLESYFSNLEQAWHAGPADLKSAGLDTSYRCLTSQYFARCRDGDAGAVPGQSGHVE